VAALSDPAIEVFVRQRREILEKPRAVSIQFDLDLCAIHVFSTFGEACSKNPNEPRVN
jgi:hypothetical protein